MVITFMGNLKDFRGQGRPYEGREFRHGQYCPDYLALMALNRL